MLKKLQNKSFRHAFLASNTRRGIAYQLRAMRGKRTQGQIGKLLGKPQNVVSRLEDPRYGKVSVQTLIEVANAYDVALLVKFVSYGRLVAETENLSHEALNPFSYEAESKLVESDLRRVYQQDLQLTKLESPASDSQQYSRRRSDAAVTNQESNVAKVYSTSWPN